MTGIEISMSQVLAGLETPHEVRLARSDGSEAANPTRSEAGAKRRQRSGKPQTSHEVRLARSDGSEAVNLERSEQW